jgi:hypothetical protein
MSKNYKLNIERGSTKTFTINYLDSNNSVMNLTNYDARMHFKEKINSVTPALSLNNITPTSGSSVLQMEAASGSILVYISATDTTLLTKDVYFYDLEVYTTSDPYSVQDPEYVVRLMEGTAIIKYNITN